MPFLKLALLMFLSLMALPGVAQVDSIVLKTGEVLIGEIKGLDRGELTLKTNYSAKDFRIKWRKLLRVISQGQFLISLSDGTLFNGKLESLNEKEVRLHAPRAERLVRKNRIVHMQKFQPAFRNRIDASISFGTSLSKGENQIQFSLRSYIGYTGEKWSVGSNFNGLLSYRDNANNVRRAEADLSLRYLLGRDWYLNPQFNFLSSSELDLDWRISARLGVGKFLIHSNRSILTVNSGFNVNLEAVSAIDSTDTSPQPVQDQSTSVELFLGGDLNLFDIKDFSLTARAVLYPSLSLFGRVRTDISLDLAYDLPLDFFLQFGGTLNFDNRSRNQLDYALQTTVGWKW
jgi:hypothetical protein